MFNRMMWHFQGEKGSMGPPGPPGYPGESVRIKTIQNKIQGFCAIVFMCNILPSDFRANLGEMEKMDFQEDPVKRSVCFDSARQYVANLIQD